MWIVKNFHDYQKTPLKFNKSINHKVLKEGRKHTKTSCSALCGFQKFIFRVSLYFHFLLG